MDDSRKTGLKIDPERLMARLEELAQIGRLDGGGTTRLALTEADKEGRDLVCRWMREAGLEVQIDQIGNIFGLRDGKTSRRPVMTGSHIDTVVAAGKYDGTYGVLAGLEVMEALNAGRIETLRPLGVAVFTNEEGVRFQPDMMGSLVHAGGLPLDQALAAAADDGAVLGEQLARLGYAGSVPCGTLVPAAYVELHIEQGPVLEASGVTIGAVENLQGISWQSIKISGQANHAGTTPMDLRHDAGYVAASIAREVRRLTSEVAGRQVGTVGHLRLEPSVINVVPARAELTVDLRNTDDAALKEAETRLAGFIEGLAAAEGVSVECEVLARFEPVTFDAAIVRLIERSAGRLGLKVRRMTSGAGHDAQMMARIAPAAMIFVPSRGGISHNPQEESSAADLEAGANVLLETLLALASEAD